MEEEKTSPLRVAPGRQGPWPGEWGSVSPEEGGVSKETLCQQKVSVQVSKAVCPGRSGLAFRLCFTLNLEKSKEDNKREKIQVPLPAGERLWNAPFAHSMVGPGAQSIFSISGPVLLGVFTLQGCPAMP